MSISSKFQRQNMSAKCKNRSDKNVSALQYLNLEKTKISSKAKKRFSIDGTLFPCIKPERSNDKVLKKRYKNIILVLI